MAFYDELAQMAKDLLQPDTSGGLGQGKIELRRTIIGTPTEPWLPPTTETQTVPLDGAVRGVDKLLVGTEADGTVLLMSDLVAFCTPPAMPYTAGDELLVDGVPVHIISYERVPAAGTTVGVRFIIRG